ncbi:MAG: hypothetical protein GOP50_02440 [Candidatus Heimdallarchaeota archaeon]|nr:hypothetical protein [Candidatus Heimdallarchaeota archaeon]
MAKITKFIKLKFFCIILCPLLLTSIITFQTPITHAKLSNNSTSVPVKANYVEREAIIVDNDTHFASFSFPGTGAIDDPYIIENYNITSGTGSGIRIRETTVYFIIRDCYISEYSNGIRLNSVAPNTSIITNNICYNTYSYGIDIIASEQINVTNNYINTDLEGGYRYTHGISSSNANSNYIANNTCLNGQLYGIYVDYGYLSIIHNNTCINNDYGIKVQSSNSSTISKNLCSSNNYREIFIHSSGSCIVVDNICSDSTMYGMYVAFSDGSTIENNTFDKSGLFLYQFTLAGYLSYTIKGNTVNTKLLGYFKHEEDLVLSYPTYGQIFLLNCTNSLISNQDFHDLPYGAIFVLESPDTHISSNYFRRIGKQAVFIKDSLYSGVTYNHFEDSYFRGLFLDNSDYATVGDNTFLRSTYSLYCYQSNDPIIISNSFELTSRTDIELKECLSPSVINNFCDNSGIVLYAEMNYGLVLNDVGYAYVSGNTFYKYEGYGIEIVGTDYSEIASNLFQENEDYGIYLTNSRYNTIHHNTFQYNNIDGDYQAYSDDYGYNNYWYDPLLNEGNYYSDWSGTGPYTVGFDTDPYPLGEPSVPPIISEFQRQYGFVFSILLLPFLAGLYYFRRIKK